MTTKRLIIIILPCLLSLLGVACHSNKGMKTISIFFNPAQSFDNQEHQVMVNLNNREILNKKFAINHVPKDRYVGCFTIDSTVENKVLIKINFKEIKIDLSKIHSNCINIFTSYDNLSVAKNKFKIAEQSFSLKSISALDFSKYYDSIKRVSPKGMLDSLMITTETTKCLCDSTGRGYGF